MQPWYLLGDVLSPTGKKIALADDAQEARAAVGMGSGYATPAWAAAFAITFGLVRHQ